MDAASTTPFGQLNDNYFMEQALVQARKAAKSDEVPVGAVIVEGSGRIIARAYNRVETLHSQTAHAEALAIAKAGKKIGDWRLLDCWLYVTLQPCAVCMGLAQLSRLKGVVYGAASPRFGYHLDNGASPWVYKKDTMVILPQIKADQSAQLLQHFFRQKRKKRE